MAEFVLGVITGTFLSALIFFIWDGKLWVGIYKLTDYRNSVRGQMEKTDNKRFYILNELLKSDMEGRKNKALEIKMRQTHKQFKELELTFKVLKKVFELLGLEGGEE